jgi:hypothetical protein
VKRLCILLAALLALVPALAQAAPTPAALTWLHAQQQPDGGFVGLNGKTDPSTTADVAVAFAAAGVSPGTVTNQGKSIVDFLQDNATTYGATTGGAAKLTLAAVAAGLDPSHFGGLDLVRAVSSKYDQGTGLYDPQIYVDSLAILALKAVGQGVPAQAITALTTRQTPDGSWAFDGKTDSGAGDSNTSALAIAALSAAGAASSAAVSKGLDYLSKCQTPDGGFVYQPGAENPPVADANSTALAIQALRATGIPADSSTVAHATTALAGFQNADGAFYYRPDAKQDNVLATVQAVPALLELPLPIAAHSAAGSVAPATGRGPGLSFELVAGLLALTAGCLGLGCRLRRRAA